MYCSMHALVFLLSVVRPLKKKEVVSVYFDLLSMHGLLVLQLLLFRVHPACLWFIDCTYCMCWCGLTVHAYTPIVIPACVQCGDTRSLSVNSIRDASVMCWNSVWILPSIIGECASHKIRYEIFTTQRFPSMSCIVYDVDDMVASHILSTLFSSMISMCL